MSKQFKPMRSVAPDHDKYPITFPKIGSFKLDGIRLCMYEGQLLTKSGKQLPNNYIREWALKYMPTGLDFEIISGPPNLQTTYSTTFSAAMTIEGEPDFTFYVFDVCSFQGAESATATQRSAYAETLCFELEEFHPGKIKFVPQRMIHNQEELDAFYALALESGFEGVILKDPKGKYKWGKCTAKEQIQLKLKPEVDKDAIITGFYEAMENTNEAFTNELGETKRSSHAEGKVGKGTLGGFLATDVETGRPLRCGKGRMTAEEAQQVWDNRQNYLGNGFKYRALAYGEKDLPRHLRWIAWRGVVDMEVTEVTKAIP